MRAWLADVLRAVAHQLAPAPQWPTFHVSTTAPRTWTGTRS